jgi:phage RecT family recombinase
MTNIQKAKKESVALTGSQLSLKQHIQSQDFFQQIQNALPEGNLSARRYISACLTALAVEPKLLQCKPSSVMKAMMESARYGLEPNSPLSEAALVPYGDKVNFLIEYRGLMKLAWNTGLIKSMDYDKVCESDEFTFRRSQNGIEFAHTPNLFGDRGDVFAYYAIAELKNGGMAFHVMSKDEIEAHGKQFSRSFNHKSSPWQTDFNAMAYKTVIRQLCDKKLPKSTTEHGALMQEAAHFEDFPVSEKRHIVMQENEIIVNDIEAPSMPEIPDVEEHQDVDPLQGFDSYPSEEQIPTEG